ncbi:glutathione S-transferase T2-like [Brassica napus]|uniref:glutathione S-transferase T2-like n=1 Tax=Brassica napus TaxID=3708 RepID=UPI002078A1C3|nr:glutathione S-transferase T2-like [Brassica napus]
MDSKNPSNPYSDSPSQNFQYGSYRPSQNFGGGSEMPPFSSQAPEAPAQRENASVASKERRQWTPADDEIVISAWLNTSKDVVVGNEQKSGTFWKRVAEFYASSPHAKASGEPREWLNLKQRWQKINDYTNKFCGAYAAAERHISSGQSETDVLKAAYDIYFANHQRKFNLEHALCLLSATVGDQEVRPEGSKAAKARKNNTQGLKSIDEIKTVMELKKDDLMRKENLSKLAILDTLLTKPGTLSEAEEVVKNKLLAQLF